MSRDYDVMGLHDAAALVRCKKIDAIRNMFDDLQSCITANTVVVRKQETNILPTEQQIQEAVDRRMQDEEELHIEQQQRYEDLYTQLKTLEQAVKRPRVVERRVVQPLLSEDEARSLRIEK